MGVVRALTSTICMTRCSGLNEFMPFGRYNQIQWSMMDPISIVSIGVSTLGAIAAAYAIHQNLESLSILPEELRSLSDECSRLEETLRAIRTIQLELVQQGRASSSKVDRSAIVPIVNGALADAQKRLSDLQSFINYMSKKVQENDKGDHWQWIKKKNSIDKLQANLQSIRYDLTVRCSNASPEYFDKELFRVQQKGKETFQAPNQSEPEPWPRAWESSSFWPELLHCSCIGRRLPSSIAIKRWFRRTCSRIRTCYLLVALGMISIAGSLALALWRTINNGDIQGGFSIAQYVLAVGALIIGCVLVLHSRTCSCWSSSSSKGGNGTLLDGHPIELPQFG